MGLVFLLLGLIILGLGYGTIRTSATSDAIYKELSVPVDFLRSKIQKNNAKPLPRKIVGIIYAGIGLAVIALGLLIE